MEQETVGNEFEKNRSIPADGLNPSDAQSGISGSRRRFSRLSLVAAPIVVSLVSKPVLGAQCLSNMMSGNLSNPDRGNCSKGWSPGGWGQPGGTINGVQDAQAWTLAGYTYGIYDPALGNVNQASSYSGGSTVANLPGGLMTQSPSTKTLRDVLNSAGKKNRDRHVLCAWLNAKLSENSGGNFNYLLTTAQVTGLANGSIPLPPPYIDLNTFLGTTWQ